MEDRVKKSVVESLKGYSRKVTSFHMPGHKLGKINPLKGEELFSIDVTEVDETDDLHHPYNSIRDSMGFAQSVYQSDKTYYLVNGSSVGILAGISCSCEKGDEILIARNCHKAVYHGITFRELSPYYIYPDYIDELNIWGGISPATVRQQLEEHPDSKAVVLTSPTYDGVVSDIGEISKIVHEFGKILIVDEAHGAHFNYSTIYPKSALEEGADIVIQSVHKTLPALTQTALLHVKSSCVNVRLLEKYLEMYQTSSPSFVLISSIDSCICYMDGCEDKVFKGHSEQIEKLRTCVKQLKHIKMLDHTYINQYNIKDIDQSKLVFFGKDVTIKGKAIEKLLYDKYDIGIEMAMVNGLLLISTIADQEKDFELLIEALTYVDRRIDTDYADELCFRGDISNTINIDKMIDNQTRLLPSEVLHKKSKKVDYIEAVGRICSEFVYVYPPGIPLLVPGEVVTQLSVDTISTYEKAKLRIVGCEEGQLSVLE